MGFRGGRRRLPPPPPPLGAGSKGKRGTPPTAFFSSSAEKKPRQKKGDWRTSGGRGIKGGREGKEANHCIRNSLRTLFCRRFFPAEERVPVLMGAWGSGGRDDGWLHFIQRWNRPVSIPYHRKIRSERPVASDREREVKALNVGPPSFSPP